MMRLVAITGEPFLPAEAGMIRLLLEEGIDRVHLRKPGSAPADMRRLIEALPSWCYGRLSLHDHLPLAAEYGLGGVHLNGRNPAAPPGFDGAVSRSCHSLRELAESPDADYLFLSPLFDSISKAGYRARYTREELLDAAAAGVVDRRTVALGGIDPPKLPLLEEWGFGGAAVLGYLWRDATPARLVRRVAALRGALG